MVNRSRNIPIFIFDYSINITYLNSKRKVRKFFKNLIEELMNTGTKKKKNSSVFAEVAKPSGLESLNEAIVSQDKPKPKAEAVKEVVKEIDDLYVFEIHFKKEDSSYLLFANEINLDDDSLALFNVFTRYILQEVINPQEKIIVNETGRKELPEKDFKIPFIYGVMIKKILREPWMDRSEEETKKSFDEKVLKAYRDYKESLLKFYNNTVNNNQNFNEQDEDHSNVDKRYEGINRKEIKGL